MKKSITTTQIQSIHERQFIKVLNAAWDYHQEYGKVTIKEAPRHIIIEFYNGGWSANEDIDAQLEQVVRATISDHPMHIYIFDKGLLDKKTYEKIVRTKIKKYIYKLVRD